MVGVLYDFSLSFLIVITIAIEIIAIPFFYIMWKNTNKNEFDVQHE